MAYNLEFSTNTIKKLVSKRDNCSQHTDARLMFMPVNFRKALLGSSLLDPKHKCHMLKGVVIGPHQLALNLLPGSPRLQH